ncbi:MAG TPA: elongation factor G [Puia sp.]|nr:elongation factor G [Puia sp.]
MKRRNIGIMAHVDAGKTTVTERILYYTRLTHQLGNVDEGNTMMDTDPQEEQRGITISSASITTYWNYAGDRYIITLIDTPGHVDFTAEVERSLRVLDGAIAVFCAKSGVQSQSETVWHQADRYQVPRIILINKMDRQGADFINVVTDIREKLQANAVPVQLPIGSEDAFAGVIDLVNMQALVWDNSQDGKTYQATTIPSVLLPAAEEARKRLLEELALVDEGLFEQYTTDSSAITAETIRIALRQATVARKLIPVLCGAAYRNKGMQPLLDAAVLYLPAPEDVPFVTATRPDTEQEVQLATGKESPFAGLVFKILTNDYTGKLSLVRVYAGTLRAGDTVWNSRAGKNVRVNRLLRIMSDKYEAVEQLQAGDIGAMLGIKEVRTGDTLSATSHPVVLETIRFPAPMIGYAIEARSAKESVKLSEALSRLLDEDPTLSVEVDASSGQTILKGMGELHLEVVLEKLRSVYDVEVNKGQPQIAYKEVFTSAVTHCATYKKQNGGSGNFAEIHFELSPRADGEPGLEFVDEIRGGVIPREFIISVRKGFTAAMSTGVLAGYPVESMRIRLFDGEIHEKDSHALDFEQVAHIGFKAAAVQAGPKLLEPVMCVEVALPEEYTGMVAGDLTRRRGIIKAVERKPAVQSIQAAVPLSQLFGYITTLRTLTAGRASASLTFEQYQLVSDQTSRKITAG